MRRGLPRPPPRTGSIDNHAAWFPRRFTAGAYFWRATFALAMAPGVVLSTTLRRLQRPVKRFVFPRRTMGRKRSLEVASWPSSATYTGRALCPLSGEPIFHTPRRTAATAGDREALVVPHQGYRAGYQELVTQCEE